MEMGAVEAVKTNENDFIEIPIDKYIIQEAEEKAKLIKNKLKNSITNEDGLLAGCIGEIISNFVLLGDSHNTFDFDLVKSGYRYEVKTKRCKSEPKPSYECSISTNSMFQQCDRYIFTRILSVNDRYIKGWVLGWINKDKYFEKAKKFKAGDIDPVNNFVMKHDCYNLKIDDLYRFIV